MKIKTSPSLLACDFTNLEAELARAEAAGADWHHVDVMDGHFVPNLSIGLPVVSSIKTKSNIPLDVHLMIENPGEWAERYANAGADVLTFHYEAAEHCFQKTLQTYKQTGCITGVAVNPPYGVEGMRDYLDEIDMVLIMSVHAGFGGQSFMPEVLRKVEQLREWGFDGDIQMDGGINGDNAKDCINAGANVLVAGTYLFSAQDMEASIAKLRHHSGNGCEA